MTCIVESTVRYAVSGTARFLMSVAVTDTARRSEESIIAEGPDGRLDVEELVAPLGTRLHALEAGKGEVTFSYRAIVTASPPPPAPDPFEQYLYCRPSRYCPSDHLQGFAVGEFGMDAPALERVSAVAQWVADRIEYVDGASTVHDSAEHTLLTGAGTCRDFSHLAIALCRALDVPARFVSVYAPGLQPMDFHAVFEALIDGRWLLFDPTHLAPRRTMLRIATGRDAADAAFATVTDGIADLLSVTVSAVLEGPLPSEDPIDLVELA